MELSHNHEFTSSYEVGLLRSHRKVSTVKKVLMCLMDDVNIDSSKKNHLWGAIHLGPKVVGCFPKDFENYRRDQHFEGEKEKNGGFHYVFNMDDEGHLKSVFWYDAISRRSYAFFRDIVVLDATYKTNKYEIKFIPFVGVNHHDQIINLVVA